MSDFNFEDFVNDLTTKTAPKERKQTFEPKNKEEMINKIFMSVQSNHGLGYIIPITSDDGSPATIINDVKEIKLALDDEGKYSKWVRILPKSFYDIKEGSEEERLFHEVESLHTSIINAGTLSYNEVRKRNYFLIYGYILKHKNNGNEVINENCPGLFIFDHIRAAQAFQSEIKNRVEMAGGIQWMPKFFSRDATSRKGLMTISYSKSGQGNGAVWTNSMTLATINDDHLGLTGNKTEVDIPEVSLNVFTNPVNDLLGVSSKSERFNLDKFNLIKSKMMSLLGHNVAAPTTPQTTETPEVKEEVKSANPDPF